MDRLTILTTVGSAFLTAVGTALGVLKFWSAKAVDHYLSHHLEAYKAELAAKTEALKTNLSLFAHESQIATSRVDAQRSAAIAAIWAAMQTAVAAYQKVFGDATNSSNLPLAKWGSDRAERLRQAGLDFSAVVEVHDLYCNQRTHLMLQRFVVALGYAKDEYIRQIEEAVAKERSDWTDVAQLHEKLRLAFVGGLLGKIGGIEFAIRSELRRQLKVDQEDLTPEQYYPLMEWLDKDFPLSP